MSIHPVLNVIRNEIILPKITGGSYLNQFFTAPSDQVRVWDGWAALAPDGTLKYPVYVLLKMGRDKKDPRSPIPNIRSPQFFVSIAAQYPFVQIGAINYDDSASTISSYGYPQGIQTLLESQVHYSSALGITLGKINLIGGGTEEQDPVTNIHFQDWLYEVDMCVLQSQMQLTH